MILVSCETPSGMGGGSLSGGGGGQLGGVGYDAQERKILTQARVVGALGGALLGAVVADRTDNSPWLGAALGAGLGGLAGDAVGRGQANTARNKRMDNDSLRQAIATARANNDKLAAYNSRVRARIAAIKAKPKSEQAALARAELKSVDSAIKETNELAASRQTYVNKIPPSQSSEAAAMNTEIRRGQAQLSTLTTSRAELSRMGSLASN